MNSQRSISTRRSLVVVNYLCLVAVNICFYFAWKYADIGHAVDVLGIGSLLVVAATFLPLHWQTGFWRLTHARASRLDERQLQVTYGALRHSYSWFSVIVLVIVFAHAVVYRLVPGMDFAISVPLAVSLIYLAHTLPGSILAWTEKEVPGAAA